MTNATLYVLNFTLLKGWFHGDIVLKKSIGGILLMNDHRAVYHPQTIKWEETQLASWMKRKEIETISSLYEHIEADPAWFWGEVEKELDITWLTPYEKVMDTSKGMKWTKWFTGGKLNWTIDALDKHVQNGRSKEIAVYWEGDDGHTLEVTYGDLHQKVNQCTNGLQKLGVKKGDRVAIFLPMIPETVISFLSISRLGAIAVPCFSGYGAEAVADRLNDSKAKVIITSDGFYRRGREINILEEARKATHLTSSITHMIVVERLGNYERMQVESKRWKEITYEELIRYQDSHFIAKSMDSEDPFMIIYTSGTTGRPKGTVHVHGGFPIKAAQDFMHVFDFRKEDTLFWVTDMGWVVGPMCVCGALLLGGSIVIYEGTPDYPHSNRLWSIVAKFQVTHLGVAPTIIRLLMHYDIDDLDQYDISSLRAFASTGEPWNDEPWMWLFETVGKGRIPIINHSGGTEIGGGILGCLAGLPLKPCSFTGPIPGVVADVVNEDGQSVHDQVGELVIKKPWPGMTRGFWQDDERYEDTYWSTWKSLWKHGDWARKDQDGFWFIEGRSDDTLTIAGKRVGPSEFESILVSHDLVVEAAVIGIPDDVKGMSAVGFVVLREHEKDAAVEKNVTEELKLLIGEKLGRPLRPKAIHVIPDLPRTSNGKILRRILRSVYLGEKMSDVPSMENPEVIKHIEQIIVPSNR